MGLFGLILDGITVSTAAAGIRRLTGFSIHSKVNDYFSNPSVKAASSVFFGVGEFIVDKGLLYFEKTTRDSSRREIEHDRNDTRKHSNH